VFYPNDPTESATKAVAPSVESSPIMHPFALNATPVKKPEGRPIPELLEMFSKINLSSAFGGS